MSQNDTSLNHDIYLLQYRPERRKRRLQQNEYINIAQGHNDTSYMMTTNMGIVLPFDLILHRL
jgi:hypothetical protein